MGEAYLCAQLFSYQSGWGKHKERAFSFFQAVSASNNKNEMQDLISKQIQVMQGNNPYTLLERDRKYKTNVSNHTFDKYSGILGFWQKMHTGESVVFEDKAPSSSPQCSVQ